MEITVAAYNVLARKLKTNKTGYPTLFFLGGRASRNTKRITQAIMIKPDRGCPDFRSYVVKDMTNAYLKILKRRNDVIGFAYVSRSRSYHDNFFNRFAFPYHLGGAFKDKCRISLSPGDLRCFQAQTKRQLKLNIITT